jgi:hypothetical protein
MSSSSLKIKLLLASLLVVSACQLPASETITITTTKTTTYKEPTKSHDLYALIPVKPLKKWSTTSTAIVGALIGATAGISAHLTDPIFCPFNWIITVALRNKLLRSVESDASYRGEYMDISLADQTAWISDWVTYLALPKPFMR